MKNTYRGKSKGKEIICGMVLGVVVAVVTGCGGKTEALAEDSCMEENIPQDGEKQESAFPEPDDSFMEADGSVKEPGSSFPEPGGRFKGPGGTLTEVCNSKTEKKPESVMGSVPYFRDDAGKNTQLVDGWLYGYWSHRLCRYDPETLEETVLYEAASPQHGDFCIWGEYVYFMEVPNVNAVGKRQGNLYRVKCDGSEEAVFLISVDMPGQDIIDDRISNSFQYYRMDTYDDILYLTKPYDDEENLYFRLDQEGGITRAGESETLYGRLPEGNFSRWDYSYSEPAMTLTYAMRNYGYVFMEDDTDKPVRIDLETRQTEVLDIPKGYRVDDVTNDAIIISKANVIPADNVWYGISLDNIGEIRKIGEYPDTAKYRVVTAWGAEGVYYATVSKEGYGRVFFMDREGKANTLPYDFYALQSSPVICFDENYFYYVSERQENNVVRRISLTGDSDTKAEDVAVYSSNPGWEITDRERTDYAWTDTHTGARVDHSITRVFFKEDTGAFGKINDFLEDRYTQDMELMEDYQEAMKENSEEESPDSLEEWGSYSMEYSDSYSVVWLDEAYVGIAVDWEEYWKGAAHGMHGTVYYMFDRHTGNRVSITDVTGKSPEEVCSIIAPYVEIIAMWGTDDEGWEAMLLQEGRFFLSEEGIGVHFDAYEINGYAQGSQEIIVPYEAFD